MNKDLYFIRTISDAFQLPDLKTAIEEAFIKILELSQLQEYERGFQQFKRFMDDMNNGLETFFEHLDGIMDQDFNDLYLEIIIVKTLSQFTSVSSNALNV